MFISYAQNFEDVVLRRALRDVARGTYVDVGAWDPVVDSVSWSFYLAGWTGVNVEPHPALAQAFAERRPRDTTFAVAAGAEVGSATLFSLDSSRNTTLDASLATELRVGDTPITKIDVPVAPLDQLLVEAGIEDSAIHFCSIDVEGWEQRVLNGFDVERWRPWILVIEATEPNSTIPTHGEWEPGLLDAGYQFCLFDGLNRYYVHRDQADRRAASLSYPACVFDGPFERREEAQRREALEQAASQIRWLESNTDVLQVRLATIENTFSWKVTRPLRALRRLQLARPRTHGEISVRGQAETDALKTAFALRLMTAASLLDREHEPNPSPSHEEALSSFRDALRRSSAPDGAKSWLALVTVDGSYPWEADVERIARSLRMDGADSVADELDWQFRRALARRSATTAQLCVLEDAAVVDASNTVATEIRTGIQRVVRETVSRWLDAAHPLTFVCFDLRAGFARLPTESELKRLHSWSNPPGADTAHESSTTAGAASHEVLVPWGCRLVIPELFAEPRRCQAYRALASSGVLRSLSIIGYDTVPLVASETSAEGLPADFVEYLSVVKHADRVSAISRSSAHDFAAFSAMCASQGLSGPIVEAHALPVDARTGSEEAVARVRSTLEIERRPLVLMVGSHEPRKNHLRAVEAAERLWRAGVDFQLLLIGGSSWKSEDFDELVGRLESLRRPITVWKRSSDEDLWAAYRLARFTLFPSLLEGFGLPVAESLATGTPVITSRHGSMAELAEGGGCLLVDPYDVEAIESAMEQLLGSDELLERLRGEARARRSRTWDEYAEDLWDFLVEGNSTSE